jgi:5'-nucleotidase
MKKHIILITNDDGINSPGLKAAAEAMIDIGEVFVIAPTNQQTGTGRGLTGDKKSKFHPTKYSINGAELKAYHCNCSPALIVKHSLKTIFSDKKPNLLISGINYGENLGSSITCSGTVGAALEAASVGIPSIAISKQTDIASHHEYTEQNWTTTVHFLKFFSKILLDGKAMIDVDALKIDIPECATKETEWKLTKVAKCGYYFKEFENPCEETRLNEGKIKIIINENELEKNTDIHTFAIQKMISVAPISLDLSSRVEFKELRKLYEQE